MGRKKRSICVGDAETDPFVWGESVEPFVFGFYDGDNYEEFWGDDCVPRFVEHIIDKHAYCYFHNGGNFDFYFLLEHLDPELFCIKTRIAKATIGQCELRDSFLILPLPLAAHKKDEIEYWKMAREHREHHRSEISNYLYSDCLHLYEWVKKFTDRFGTRLTLPSVAIKELRATGYEVPRTREDQDARYRPFYYGGRTQAFKVGRFDGPIQYYDINSAYPYAMLFKHPRGQDALVLDKFPNHSAPYFAVIDAISHGALPLRNADRSLDFPSDDEIRTFHATHWEIQAGLETKTLWVKKIHRVYVFTDIADFEPFVTKYYGEKLEAKLNGDKDTELHAKLLLNGCYGKFGQDARNFKDYLLTELGAVPDEALDEPRKLFGHGYDYEINEHGEMVPPEDANKVNGQPDYDLMKDRGWIKTGETETDHAVWEKSNPGEWFFNVATAASITGFVRAYLWRAICRSKDVLYCDTDSIMAKEFDGPTGNELGQWSREDSFKHIWIGGKKLYAAISENDGSTAPFKTRYDEDINMRVPILHDDKQWVTASKGTRLTPLEIQRIVENQETVTWYNKGPSFSLTQGTTWTHRQIKRIA